MHTHICTCLVYVVCTNCIKSEKMFLVVVQRERNIITTPRRFSCLLVVDFKSME